MYVLIFSDNELLMQDNDAKAFPTYDRAYHEMVRQLEEAAASDGILLEESFGLGDLAGCEADTGDGLGTVGYLEAMEAFLNEGELKWVILELPGAYIPKGACEGFRRSIREAQDMYEDNSRSDWYDADDMCKDVCWELDGYLGKE